MKELTRIVTCEITIIDKYKDHAEIMPKEVHASAIKVGLENVPFVDNCNITKIQDFIAGEE